MKHLLIVGLLFISVAGFSQKISNKISFQNGQKLEVVTEVKKTANMHLMGQNMETVITSTVTESYDVENASADSAVIEYKVKRMVANVSGGMGGSQSFDSEKDADRKGELGKLLEKALKNKYRMTVDATGKVISVKADDDNPNGKNAENDALSQLIASQFGFGFSVPSVGDASIFKILPPRELAVNDSWLDSSNANGQKRTTTYKITSLTDTEVHIDYNEEINTDTQQEMMGTQAKVRSTDTSTGKLVLDRTTGLLKQRTYTMVSKGTMEGQGMTIPSSGTTTVTVTVNAK